MKKVLKSYWPVLVSVWFSCFTAVLLVSGWQHALLILIAPAMAMGVYVIIMSAVHIREINRMPIMTQEVTRPDMSSYCLIETVDGVQVYGRSDG